MNDNYVDPYYGRVNDTRAFLEARAAELLRKMQTLLVGQELAPQSIDAFARMCRVHGLDDVANMATAEAIRRFENQLLSKQIAGAPLKGWRWPWGVL